MQQVHLREMMQEDEVVTIRIEELERNWNESSDSLNQWQITFIQSIKNLLKKVKKNIRSLT